MSNSTGRSGIRPSGQGIQAQRLTPCGRNGRMVYLSCFKTLRDNASDIKLLVKYASIPETTFEKLHGADLESARLTPAYGGGYIGFLEVSHHLHVSPTEAKYVQGYILTRTCAQSSVSTSSAWASTRTITCKKPISPQYFATGHGR